MKKLMTIAAAALCASVFADGITSANVVGYANGALRNGGTHMTSQFQAIGSEGFTLNDLRPTAYGVSAYSVDRFGRPLTTYTWTDCGGDGWDTANVWVLDDNSIVDASTIKFNAGEALYVFGSSTDEKVTSAGQVLTKDVSVQLRNGSTPVGNPYPVSIVLNDILPNAYGISLYAVDRFGRPQTTYTWTDCGGEGWDTSDVWVTDDNTIIDNSVKIGPGEGVYVFGSSTSEAIVFPAPEF